MPRQPRTSSSSKGKGQEEKTIQEIVPYAVGFKPPSKKTIFNSIGYENKIPRLYYPGEIKKEGFEFFKSVPRPNNIDDWLAQYNEEGQTYSKYLSECPWLSSRKRKYMSQKYLSSAKTLPEKYPDGKVYIVPIGDFGEAENSEFYSSLVEYTSRYLGLPVVSLPQVKLEIEDHKVFWVHEPQVQSGRSHRSSQRTRRNQLNSRYNSETQRMQICVDSNLMQLRQCIPSDAICMVGLTMHDLYGEETDLFVAGMAAGSERVAIFSLYRYDPCLSFSTEHWFAVEGVSPLPDDQRLRTILQRSCKLLVHEICHLLGLDHCIFFDCCMNGSGHLAEDFRQPMHLCPVDLRKLQTLIGFDVVERYEKLLEFYKREGLVDEETWVSKRLKYIQEDN